ncbi:hypothetical protein QW131_25125 [Roseibium salinum]|nr:hypothetical protein [Roseibium salinum]
MRPHENGSGVLPHLIAEVAVKDRKFRRTRHDQILPAAEIEGDGTGDDDGSDGQRDAKRVDSHAGKPAQCLRPEQPQQLCDAAIGIVKDDMRDDISQHHQGRGVMHGYPDAAMADIKQDPPLPSA